ncbi:MAG: Transcriptional regulator, MarR family [uncultured Rubrobacteraceae bacterium]|uniref:Transcriptional regulator, MarR family n=1 Tax=uncultured Rubrobacteraceae bacterium TaxID=349277 RepID=A0A6J4NB61_9ACTN|nr:MAG: Transcriptional regulator, MarR family [uncultured Rubrobacteraceae bacterium]
MESSSEIARESGRLEGSVGYELKKVQHDLRLNMDGELKELGVTTPQYAALSVLAEEPGLSNAGLTRRSFVTPQTMNQILVRLEAAGLVERRAHPEHGRVLQAYLTEEGERLRRECAELVDAVEERMLSGLSGGERSNLLALLRRCSAALRPEDSG